eukprot:1136803-Pelagomonas_calceolata.AAC.11
MRAKARCARGAWLAGELRRRSRGLISSEGQGVFFVAKAKGPYLLVARPREGLLLECRIARAHECGWKNEKYVAYICTEYTRGGVI